MKKVELKEDPVFQIPTWIPVVQSIDFHIIVNLHKSDSFYFFTFHVVFWMVSGLPYITQVSFISIWSSCHFVHWILLENLIQTSDVP